MFLQITIVLLYIEYNVSAALVQYCLHPEYCLNVKFYIMYDIREGRERQEARKTRRDKSPNVGTFLPRLDPAAYYCSVDSWRRGGEPGKKEASMKNIRQGIARPSLDLHFSTSKLLPRRRSRGTLNVRIGKEVTERNSVLRHP